MKMNRKTVTALLVAALAVFLSGPARAIERGALAGRNLIVIQLESFQNITVGRTLRGRPVTPNLNKLLEHGLWFSRCYPQTASGNTSDAEFLANTSLMPASEGAVFERFTSGRYDSLANALRAEGYKTGVFHGNSTNVWNRPNMYPSLGFGRYDSHKDYKPGLKIGLGLADSPFYEQTAQKLAAWKEPFFAMVISLSSHHPFKIPDEAVDFDPAPYDGTVLGDYLRSLHYADMALGEFIGELRESGLLARSLVVIYGDHGGIPLGERERLEHFLLTGGEGIPPSGKPTSAPKPAFWREQRQIPLLFLAEGSSLRGKSDTPVGQLDIAPTVAWLLDFKLPHALGTNLAVKKPGFVVFRDGSIVKDHFWITPVNGKKLVFNLGAYPHSFPPYRLTFDSRSAEVLFSSPLAAAAKMLRSSDVTLEAHAPR